MTVVVSRKVTTVARSLKVLIPRIQQNLERATDAGLPYYLEAGRDLLEAKPQVSAGSWGRWLKKNFALSNTTARRYMRAAEAAADGETGSLLSLTGETEQRRENHSSRWAREATADVDVEAVAQVRQSRKDEIGLHRELALELIDIGWKALATRLHPDRGGSHAAMRRLNRVRAELKDVAQTRSFV